MSITWFWIILISVLAIIEAATVNLVTIWFVISGIAALALSYFVNSFQIQLAIFVLGGIALIPFTKKVANMLSSNVKTNTDRLIGMVGTVTQDIEENEIGEVKADGKLWSAISSTSIKKGTKVIVLSINGVKLKVIPEDEKWKPSSL